MVDGKYWKKNFVSNHAVRPISSTYLDELYGFNVYINLYSSLLSDSVSNNQHTIFDTSTKTSTCLNYFFLVIIGDSNLRSAIVNTIMYCLLTKKNGSVKGFLLNFKIYHQINVCICMYECGCMCVHVCVCMSEFDGLYRTLYNISNSLVYFNLRAKTALHLLKCWATKLFCGTPFYYT